MAYGLPIQNIDCISHLFASDAAGSLALFYCQLELLDVICELSLIIKDSGGHF